MLGLSYVYTPPPVHKKPYRDGAIRVPGRGKKYPRKSTTRLMGDGCRDFCKAAPFARRSAPYYFLFIRFFSFLRLGA